MKKVKYNSFLCNVSDKLSSLWKSSYSSSIFCHDGGEKAKNSLIVNSLNKLPIRKYIFSPIKNFISKSIDNSFFVRKLSACFDYFLSVSLRCYGWCIVTFIAVSLFFNFLTKTFSEGVARDSFVMILTLIPTLFVSKSVSKIICESGFFSTLFIELLNCDRLYLYSKNESRGSTSGAVIIGFVASFLTLALPITDIFILLLLLVALAFFMCRPESAMLTLALVFAFAPYEINIYLSVIALISYFVKVLRGKRSIYLNLYDTPPFLFLLLYLILPTEKDATHVAVILTLLYFLFSALAKTEEFILKCIKNLFISVSLYSAYNIVSFVVKYGFVSAVHLFDPESAERANFPVSDSFSVFFVCALVISLCLLSFDNCKKRAVLLGSVFNLLALFICGSGFSFVALIVAGTIFYLCVLKNKVVISAISVAVIAISYKLFSSFSSSHLVVDTSSKLLEKYFSYILSGSLNSELIYKTEGVADAGNLWLQLAFWGGILTVSCIFVSSIVFVRNGITTVYSDISLKTKYITSVISASMIAYVIASFGCFSWDEYSVFGFFWILGGLSSASRRYSHIQNDVINVEPDDKN